MGRRFTIKFKTGPAAGQQHSVGPGEYLFIGSSENCPIRISDDPTISPTHACIFYDPSGIIRFKDMGSQFGTFRNGRKITSPIELRAGDRITLGQTTTFQSSWWNALQATRLTKFTMLKRTDSTPSLFVARLQQHRAPIAVFMIALSSIGLYKFIRDQEDSERAHQELAEGKIKHSTEKKSSKDLGVLSGTLSAKLFNKKSKRVAKPGVELTPERQFIWDEIVAVSRRFGDPPPSAMDPGFVQEVERHLHRYTKRNEYKILLERKKSMWPTIESILSKKGLPIELGYIVWIESAFQLDVVSSVGARGPWQFMPETGKEYGLAVTEAQDDRTDLSKATESAADYFADLLRMFGTERYLLAIASYNTGQNRVKRFQIASTVNKEKSSDFWHLRFVLPKETAEYVPKFMAAVIIGRNPDRWTVTH